MGDRMKERLEAAEELIQAIENLKAVAHDAGAVAFELEKALARVGAAAASTRGLAWTHVPARNVQNVFSPRLRGDGPKEA